MALSNRDRVGRGLELLSAGLRPFVEREMQAAHGERWREVAGAGLRENRGAPKGKAKQVNLDAQALLSLMANQWSAFEKTLPRAARTLVFELRDVRDRWAHEEAFTGDDAERALDSMTRLLREIGAAEHVETEKLWRELRRVRVDEQARGEGRKIAPAAAEGAPQAGLLPWREVITPHGDVTKGLYREAEFAADLAQVHRGDASAEYADPAEFFRRTFLTEGLRRLLGGALRRLSGAGGDPVVALKTNFGGGKTHSMLALYHLFSGAPAAQLLGVDELLAETGVASAPKARIAVLVGTDAAPGKERKKRDGTVVRTLWGDLAWQLLGKEGYARVEAYDKNGTSPGSGDLRDLFAEAAPCLILIDEWVAYVRQLFVHPDDKDKGAKRDLPGGTFEANMTFAQALTEAAKAAPKTLLVASLPASDIETGGEGGKDALRRLENVFGRVETAWRPASAEEGFEIVRRRLFLPITDPAKFKARDAVAKAFADYYAEHRAEFPEDCGEGAYRRRIEAAYPIHPELFDRLYTDWGALERFQRTRGVLRLMAAVIHALWAGGDRNVLILPGMAPIADPRVQNELTQYLDDPWTPILERDVDGPASAPVKLDRENPNFGRQSAALRVARTLFLGSAPTLHAASPGLEDRRVKLGCAQPGESHAVFGDALRRLPDHTNHLYVDGRRYWYSTQPSVTQLARDRANQQTEDAVSQEIGKLLKEQMRERGEFAKVHPAPASSADVPDEPEARLVILGPEHPHAKGETDGPGMLAAKEMLEQRGSTPRQYRNALVFAPPDRARLDDLKQAVRALLAWRSILRDAEALNLDKFAENQAKTKAKEAEETVKARFPEAYPWLLSPAQPKADGDIEWRETRIAGAEAIGLRASKKLVRDGALLTTYGGALLLRDLDGAAEHGVALWRGDSVSLKDLRDHCAKYPYLPRLRDGRVLEQSVRTGVESLTWETDGFAYAQGYDEAKKRFLGLVSGGKGLLPSVDLERGILVKSEAALAQLARERPKPEEREGGGQPGGKPRGGEGGVVEPPGPRPKPKARRFHGSVVLDPTRIIKHADQIANEVVQHLAKLDGATVTVTLEVQADIPEGAPEDVVRTVTENIRTLKFTDGGGFEEW